MGIMIEANLAKKIGLASHQNAIPLIGSIAVANNSEEEPENLTLLLIPSLPFANKKTWTVDLIRKGSRIHINDRDIDLKEGYLAELSENMRASITLTLSSGERILLEENFPIELLARNVWGGAGSMPELLAAFCMPNDPAVDSILKGASDVLRRAGKSDAIDGYNTKSRKRVWELCSALWTAISNVDISYAVPPASFEREGQKIRTPTQILDGKVATCLDTALLFAAALEQAGLHPFIIMTEGHAFSGVWLQPQEFASIITDDVSAIRKRIQLQELIVFETTLATQSPRPRFSHAVDNATNQLTDENFILALDLQRARMQRIRPMATTVHSEDARDAKGICGHEGFEEAPNLQDDFPDDDSQPSGSVDRIKYWQRKLLDLTTRNRLLHVPENAKVVRLICPDPGKLEDLLADNRSLSIVPLPNLQAGGRDVQIYEQRNQKNLEEEFARDALARNQVPSKMEKEALEARLVDLYRQAKSDIEEGGSNKLYLAVGFLKWKKSAGDSKTYSAPLILIPVKLERKSALSSVKMSMLEEPEFNLTLLELLRHDFEINIPSLGDELRTDQSSIDVNRIWNIMRRAVRDIAGFEVTPDVLIGTFSFAKYLMWRDLKDRADQLRQSDVVRHLLEYRIGQSTFQSNETFPLPENLDEEVEPRELFTPLPADSSQVAAIVASAKGHNFILDGPPGTGKSQTIANMIAHNLALGRRVLFVAEKMAALDVVKRRLDQKGVGQFCLELHSNKTSKLHVLKQLECAWGSRGQISQEDWDEQANKVLALRTQLNGFVKVLHRRWPNGWTIQNAIGLVIKESNPRTPNLSWPAGTEHTKVDMEAMRSIAHRLDLNKSAVEEINGSFSLLISSEWSNAWQASLVDSARHIDKALLEVNKARDQVLALSGLPLKDSPVNANELYALIQHLPDAHRMNLRFLFSPATAKTLEAAPQGISLVRAYREQVNKLSRTYDPDTIASIDTTALRNEWERASKRFWFFSYISQKKLVKALQAQTKTDGLPNLPADLPIIEGLQQQLAQLKALENDLVELPGWSGRDTDITEIDRALQVGIALRAAISQLATSTEHLLALRQSLQLLVVDGNDLLSRDGQLAHAIMHLRQKCEALEQAAKQFATVSGAGIDLAKQVDELAENARTVLSHETHLKAWCDWQRIKTEANAAGLGILVDAIEKKDLINEEAAKVFKVAYAKWFASTKIDAEPLLRNFVPAEHASDIEAYRQAEDKLAELTAAYINVKLTRDLPSKFERLPSSGFAMLKRELQKSRRHKPVRRLIQEMGDAFTTLAPCMLMSPLSIAQYLPADQALFDLVIFDEASQITPWDAIGAIARGKQVVIAGDQRQMPPTSFFNRGANAEDDDTDEDLESILDECMGAGIPSHSLTWHYRSRHESLITFSNYKYYDGKLITFPAADTRESAIVWRHVNGIYAKGKGRSNQLEAKSIVAEVVKRLTEPKQQTIGIITLNVEQQQLINDLLDKARQEHPEIEPYFAENLAEPVIVKNLETMQGDERDVIILSIGFGPTEPGAKTMGMNFGPLNKEGGWRRLNVALTRARQEMIVFTSFPPSMLDLNRTSARAIADLRHFLEFVKDGPDAIARQVKGTLGSYDSPFEEYVADGLRTKGWETRSQIGVSRFRIDLGVVHPDRPGDYLAGVECDGASYHSAATARDRDKVRSEILKGLNWKLVRIWSTEWWIDKRGALDRLDQALRALLEASREEIHKKVLLESESVVLGIVADNTSEKYASDDTSAGDEIDQHEHADSISAMGYRRVADFAGQSPLQSVKTIYQAIDLKENYSNIIDDTMFYEIDYDPTLNTLIKAVLEQEAPILDKLLVHRIARAHGFQRSGGLIWARVLGLAEKNFHIRNDPAGGRFVWLEKGDHAKWNRYRIPETAESRRSIDEIASEELKAAKLAVNGDDLPVEVARLFGVSRLGLSARKRILSAAKET